MWEIPGKNVDVPFIHMVFKFPSQKSLALYYWTLLPSYCVLYVNGLFPYSPKFLVLRLLVCPQPVAKISQITFCSILSPFFLLNTVGEKVDADLVTHVAV